VADQVRFQFRNMLDTGFDTVDARDLDNETTMYVDLHQCSRVRRLLVYGGRYVCITGCYNDVTGGRSRAVSRSTSTTSATSIPQRILQGTGRQRFRPINVID